MTPERLAALMGCPLSQAQVMLVDGSQYDPIVQLHAELKKSPELTAAGVTLGQPAFNFEAYFRQPNPYGATSLRVVQEHGCPALFAANEGVSATSPTNGPKRGSIMICQNTTKLIQALLAWTKCFEG
jgi:hypothetical protein